MRALLDTTPTDDRRGLGEVCTTSVLLMSRVLVVVASSHRLAAALGVSTSSGLERSPSVVCSAAVNMHGPRGHARPARRAADPVPASWLQTPVEPRFRWGYL